MKKTTLIENIKKSLVIKLKENKESNFNKKTRFDYKSKLEGIIQQVWAESNLEKAKQLVVDFLKDSTIKGKETILNNLSIIKTKPNLDKYMSNSLLAFEKMKVNEDREILDSQPEVTYNIEDQIGNFWVVKKAMKESGEDDLISETDVFGLAEMISQGLTKESITGLYKTESRARNNSRKLLKQRDSELKEDIKNGSNQIKELERSIGQIKLEIKSTTDRGMDEPGLRDSISQDVDRLYKKLDKQEDLLDRLKKSLDKESNKDENKKSN